MISQSNEKMRKISPPSLQRALLRLVVGRRLSNLVRQPLVYEEKNKRFAERHFDPIRYYVMVERDLYMAVDEGPIVYFSGQKHDWSIGICRVQELPRQESAGKFMKNASYEPASACQYPEWREYQGRTIEAIAIHRMKPRKRSLMNKPCERVLEVRCAGGKSFFITHFATNILMLELPHEFEQSVDAEIVETIVV